MRTPIERFETHLDKSSSPIGCWLWTRSVGSHGYGQFWETGRLWLAHRWLWTQINGPIPEGMLLQHSCDEPRCCNPEHLSVGTDRSNKHDSIGKGRSRGRMHATPDEARRAHNEVKRASKRRALV